MSNEFKSTEKPFEFPMMPIFGIDLGERLGELAAGQRQTRSDIQELKAEIKAIDAKIEALDTKFEAKTDKMANTIHRLDERVKHLSTVTWGGIIVLLIAIVAQKLL